MKLPEVFFDNSIIDEMIVEQAEALLTLRCVAGEGYHILETFYCNTLLFPFPSNNVVKPLTNSGSGGEVKSWNVNIASSMFVA